MRHHCLQLKAGEVGEVSLKKKKRGKTKRTEVAMAGWQTNLGW
jgi:hypothetical protein